MTVSVTYREGVSGEREDTTKGGDGSQFRAFEYYTARYSPLPIRSPCPTVALLLLICETHCVQCESGQGEKAAPEHTQLML